MKDIGFRKGSPGWWSVGKEGDRHFQWVVIAFTVEKVERLARENKEQRGIN